MPHGEYQVSNSKVNNRKQFPQANHIFLLLPEQIAQSVCLYVSK